MRRYRNQSLRYLRNASEALGAGEPEKAGEFLWGGMAQALKAVAATKGILLRSHAMVGNYARQLSEELGDKSILNAFDHASHLHSNFYETALPIDTVERYGQDIRRAVDRLLDLARGGTG